MSLIQLPVLRVVMLLCQPNLGKTCPTIFFWNLMPLVSPYLSKAYQLNLMIVFPLSSQILILDLMIFTMGIEICLGLNYQSPIVLLSSNLGYGHTLFISSGHDLFDTLLVTVLTGRVSLYIVTLTQFICVAWDFLLVMSDNGVMTKTSGAVTKPRAFCVCAHGCATRHTLVSQLEVIIHYDYINMLSSVGLFLETIYMLFVKWSNNICHLCWIKRAYHFHVCSYFFWSW
jgi:hypothetical protein